MKRFLGATLAVIATLACESNQPQPQKHERVAAANALANRYAHSRMERWNIRSHAMGEDCGILHLETVVVMDDSMVEALHYGIGAYDVYKGGIRQFSRDRAFRGVAYSDGTGRVWTYGDVGPSEARALPRCR